MAHSEDDIPSEDFMRSLSSKKKKKTRKEKKRELGRQRKWEKRKIGVQFQPENQRGSNEMIPLCLTKDPHQGQMKKKERERERGGGRIKVNGDSEGPENVKRRMAGGASTGMALTKKDLGCQH